jgi:hypothetical protein
MFGIATASSGHPFLAIARSSASILLFEVLLTRLFSVILFYHLAFVAILVGMLGLAASGSRCRAGSRTVPAESAARDIHAAALRYTAAAVVAILRRQTPRAGLPWPSFSAPSDPYGERNRQGAHLGRDRGTLARGTGLPASASSSGSGTRITPRSWRDPMHC